MRRHPDAHAHAGDGQREGRDLRGHVRGERAPVVHQAHQEGAEGIQEPGSKASSSMRLPLRVPRRHAGGGTAIRRGCRMDVHKRYRQDGGVGRPHVHEHCPLCGERGGSGFLTGSTILVISILGFGDSKGGWSKVSVCLA